MLRMLAVVLSLALVFVLGGCSQSDRESARQREAQAKEKADRAGERLSQDAKKLGHEIKTEARALDRKITNAVNNPAPASNGTSQAEDKVARGAHDLHIEANQAGVKLDRAALIAKVKTKLATDVGLSTVTGVDVDTTGQVITLRGTVDSMEQKQQAEQAALQVSGVTKVVNNLTVK